MTAPALWRESELEPFLGFGEYFFLPDPIVWTEVDYADAKAKEAEEEVEAEEALPLQSLSNYTQSNKLR